MKVSRIYFAIADRNAFENTESNAWLALFTFSPCKYLLIIKLVWPRESLFHIVYYIIKMMKLEVNKEEA